MKKDIPSIYDYSDYRVYLRDFYLALKSRRAGYSYRAFSRAAGFTSPNFLKLVIDGARNLTADSLERFATALELSRAERDYFRELVRFNQADTPEEKQAHAERLAKSRPARRVHPLREAQLLYYTHWYYVAIRELAARADFSSDPAWVAEQLNPRVTAAQAARALSDLEKLGLLVRDDQGRLAQTTTIVATDDEVASEMVGSFHREMLRLASESIERFRGKDREVSSVTVGLSPSSAHQIKEAIQRFRGELLQIAAADTSPSRVFQLNFQLFPLSEEKPKP